MAAKPVVADEGRSAVEKTHSWSLIKNAVERRNKATKELLRCQLWHQGICCSITFPELASLYEQLFECCVHQLEVWFSSIFHRFFTERFNLVHVYLRWHLGFHFSSVFKSLQQPNSRTYVYHDSAPAWRRCVSLLWSHVPCTHRLFGLDGPGFMQTHIAFRWQRRDYIDLDGWIKNKQTKAENRLKNACPLKKELWTVFKVEMALLPVIARSLQNQTSVKNSVSKCTVKSHDSSRGLSIVKGLSGGVYTRGVSLRSHVTTSPFWIVATTFFDSSDGYSWVELVNVWYADAILVYHFGTLTWRSLLHQYELKLICPSVWLCVILNAC